MRWGRSACVAAQGEGMTCAAVRVRHVLCPALPAVGVGCCSGVCGVHGCVHHVEGLLGPAVGHARLLTCTSCYGNTQWCAAVWWVEAGTDATMRCTAVPSVHAPLRPLQGAATVP